MKKLCDGSCPCPSSGRPSGLLSAILPTTQSGKPPIPTPDQLHGKSGANHSGQVTVHLATNKQPVQPSSAAATGQSSGASTTHSAQPIVQSQIVTVPMANIGGVAKIDDRGIIYIQCISTTIH